MIFGPVRIWFHDLLTQVPTELETMIFCEWEYFRSKTRSFLHEISFHYWAFDIWFGSDDCIRSIFIMNSSPRCSIAIDGGGGSGYQRLKLHDLPARMRQKMLMRPLALQVPEDFYIHELPLVCLKMAYTPPHGMSNREKNWKYENVKPSSLGANSLIHHVGWSDFQK